MNRCAKVRYRTELDAKIALANTQHRDNPKRAKTEKRAYWCHICHAYHLTSKGRR